MVGFDKQFLREWLKSGGGGFGANGGGVEEEGVEIPDDVIKATFGKYEEAYHLLTGKKFIPWSSELHMNRLLPLAVII